MALICPKCDCGIKEINKIKIQLDRDNKINSIIKD